MWQDIKDNWNKLSNEWKATFRTFAQSVIAAFTIALLGLMNIVLNWLNGGEVNWYQDLSNVARLGGIALIGAMTAVVTFVWNKFGNAPEYKSGDSG